jgi:hypothetical protein
MASVDFLDISVVKVWHVVLVREGRREKERESRETQRDACS